ncbi:MAG: hypothetical protein WCO06_03945 [Candidatus Roizmanbacteria bacterium]
MSLEDQRNASQEQNSNGEILKLPVPSVVRVLCHTLLDEEHLNGRLQEYSTNYDGIVRWIIPLKSALSVHHGKAEFFGGNRKIIKGELEDPKVATKREGREEVNARALFDMRDIGTLDYTIPGMPNGDRNATFLIASASYGDIPYPIDPEEAKIGEVLLLTSPQLITLMTEGFVTTNINGDMRTIEGLDYLHLGKDSQVFHDSTQRGTLFTQIMREISQVEEVVKNQLNLSLGQKRIERIRELYKYEANSYLKEFSKERAYRYVFPLMYSMCGFKGQGVQRGEDILNAVGILEDSQERLSLNCFLTGLRQTFSELTSSHADGEDLNEIAKEYDRRVSEFFRMEGLLSESSTLGTIQETAEKFLSDFAMALNVRGISMKSVDIINDIRNAKLYDLADIFFNRSLYGKQVDNNTLIFDAGRHLALIYTIMRLTPEYQKKKDAGSRNVHAFLTDQFPLVKDVTVRVGDIYPNARVRCFTTDDGKRIAVCWDESLPKTLSSFARKVILGEDPRNIHDIYRHYVTVVGFFDTNDVFHELDGTVFENQGPLFSATRMIFDGFSERFDMRYSGKTEFKIGDNKGVPGKIVDNISNPKPLADGKRKGSIANLFAWMKFYTMQMKINETGQSEADKAGEWHEVALFAMRNGIEDPERQTMYGLIEKMKDDEQYAFGRLIDLYPWFYPDELYSWENMRRLIYTDSNKRKQ